MKIIKEVSEAFFNQWIVNDNSLVNLYSIASPINAEYVLTSFLEHGFYSVNEYLALVGDNWPLIRSEFNTRSCNLFNWNLVPGYTLNQINNVVSTKTQAHIFLDHFLKSLSSKILNSTRTKLSLIGQRKSTLVDVWHNDFNSFITSRNIYEIPSDEHAFLLSRFIVLDNLDIDSYNPLVYNARELLLPEDMVSFDGSRSLVKIFAELYPIYWRRIELAKTFGDFVLGSECLNLTECPVDQGYDLPSL